MKEWSTDMRHFCGGFVGGVLGLLVFSIIHWLLPIGCLAGVVLGFYASDIWNKTSSTYAQVTKRFSLSKIFSRPAKVKVEASTDPVDLARRAILQGRKIASLVYFGTMLLISWFVPIFGIHNRMDRIFLGLFLALLGILFGLTLRMASSSNLLDYSSSIQDNFASAKTRDAVKNPDRSHSHQYIQMRMKSYWLLLGLWQKYGQRLIGREVILTMLSMLLAPFILGGMLVAGFMAVLLFGLPLFAVGWTFFAVIHYTYKLALGKGHWLCLGVTVITTNLVAYLTQHQLHGVTLWLAAMFAGFASGALSIQGQRVLKWVIAKIPSVAAWMEKDPASHVNHIADMIWRNLCDLCMGPRYQRGVWGFNLSRRS